MKRLLAVKKRLENSLLLFCSGNTHLYRSGTPVGAEVAVRLVGKGVGPLGVGEFPERV